MSKYGGASTCWCVCSQSLLLQNLTSVGTNERRCIARQSLDYYRAVIVGGVYIFESEISDHDLRHALIKSLKHCIAVHPILSTTIVREETETPAFARPLDLDLNNHVEILNHQRVLEHDNTFNEPKLIKTILCHVHDQPLQLRDKTPPWRVVVVPLPGKDSETENRFLILLAYYHSHGDGRSGLAFHQSLLPGLNLALGSECPYTSDVKCLTPKIPLLPPMEKLGRLHVSWTYLLSPLLGEYLPKFLSGILGLRSSATPEGSNAWCGRDTFHDPNNLRTGVEIVTVDDSTMQKVLSKCKTHRAKLTGLLHQLIVRGLSQALPTKSAGCFISQSAVDLRGVVDGITRDDMALCPTAYYELFPRSDTEQWTGWTNAAADDNSIWAAARNTTEGLAKCAGTLDDQPIGLLAYLKDYRGWSAGKIGKRRDGSYELSNLGSFEPGTPGQLPSGRWQMESLIFSQPANAPGGCFNFNVVTRSGGDMVLVLSWQLGALDVEDEQDLAERVGASIQSSLEELACA